jgi:branched-chain amino acid transport system permease protein
MLDSLPLVIDGLVYGSWLFIVAVGLTLVFGVMRILNVAHGSFYALGAYLASTFVGMYFAHGLPAAGSPGALLLAAIVVGVTLGLLLEQCLLRWFYGRDEVLMILVTYSVFLVLEDVAKAVWGAAPVSASQPYAAFGSSSIGNLRFSNYDLSLIAVSIAVAGVLWYALERTHRGKLLRFVIFDREAALALGINVRRYFTWTFVAGAFLGAFGGAITAPIVSIQPGIGAEAIILAFAVVVIGGLGSPLGAAVGAILVGLGRAAAVHFRPELELFIIYATMALMLAIRPEGLFAQAKARRI